MSRWFEIIHPCSTDGIPRRSLAAALLVGTVLNLINQGDALLGDGDVNAFKITLTFLVPYCVATYGAVSSKLGTSRRPS